MMPPSPATAAARAAQKAALARAAHAAHTDPAIGSLLARLEKEEGGGDASTDASAAAWRAANVREARRAYGKATAIPEDVAAAKAALESEGYAAWVAARAASSFSDFAPTLERIVALERGVAARLAPVVAAAAGRADVAEPYDALLDAYEKGCTAARLEAVFAGLKAGLVPLLAAVRAQGTPPDIALLTAGAPYDPAAQAALCARIAASLGFDTDAGRLDVSVHPFTGGAGPADVRMTTRFKAGDLAEGLTGAIHETGHALYEQGRPGGEQEGLPASGALSMGAHESQSLLWERHVGLSRPFCAWLAPQLGAAFPGAPWAPAGPDPAALWRALNAVRPPDQCLIRVEADELTYPAHVLLRFDIERALINGQLAVSDVPSAWAAASQALLGVVPPTDAAGPLQDVHWSAGALGYFPTYLIGAAAAAQFFEAAAAALPDLDARIAAGDFGPLRAWLRENVHARGSAPPSLDALLTEVTGGPLSVAPLLRHLAAKYEAVYCLPPGVAAAAIAPGLAAAAAAAAGGGETATA